MNNVKKNFSIRDLENLSGIKAHTIRMWEKRYTLLTPERTATNIRTYSLTSLQKLLNVTLLYNNGYKISKIAKIAEGSIALMAKEIVAKNSVKDQAIHAFKLAMINFDQALFMTTYNSILVDKSFREVFRHVFVPLLNEIGLLWQTDTISPAHEHFISCLIKQKILVQTEIVQQAEPTQKSKIFVPFLPENEIHEIGLLYLNYEIVSRGYKSIYLGQTIPMDTLSDVMKYFNNICFLSYFTVSPTKDKIDTYLAKFADLIETHGASELWLLGYQTKHLQTAHLPNFVRTFTSIEKVIEQL